MKIHLLSDLHLEFSTPSDRFGAVDSDVVVLAGDIHTGAMGIAWAGLSIRGLIRPGIRGIIRPVETPNQGA